MKQVRQNCSLAILTVSFGTTNVDSLRTEIGAVEQAVAGRFPEYELRRAFVSQALIEQLKKTKNLQVDSVREALEKAVEDRITLLAVQPTYFVNGYEYETLEKMIREYEDRFERIVIGEPLLKSEEDYIAAAEAVAEKASVYDDGSTAVCFMGHGVRERADSQCSGLRSRKSAAVHSADCVSEYIKVQEKLIKAGYTNYYIGTMQSGLSVEDLLKTMRCREYERIVLMPFMLTAGRHARREMAGSQEDSWKSIFEREGYEVMCVIEGLGRLRGIQQIYAAHTETALYKIFKE